MFINEVEHIVGLSAKSIRYYEGNGLLTPKRNQDNGYRIYTEEEIKKLKIIKILRELGVPIRELKLLSTGELTIEKCMEDRINKINEQEKNYNNVKNMCIEISKSKSSFNNIDIDKYFEKINKLNKEGFTMREIKTNKVKKIRGAVLSSIIFSSFFLIIITFISYFQFKENDNIPWIVYFILIGLLIIPLIGIIYNLIIRIKEINGGEEDEASKY